MCEDGRAPQAFEWPGGVYNSMHLSRAAAAQAKVALLDRRGWYPQAGTDRGGATRFTRRAGTGWLSGISAYAVYLVVFTTGANVNG